MRDSKRWYVLRPIKLNSGEDVPAGKYLTKKQMEELPNKAFSLLVRQVRLYDVKGEVDNPWNEKNKHKLRLKCFGEIGTADAKALMQKSIERLAASRLKRFGGVNEKAIAAEIAASAKPDPEPVAVEAPEPKSEETLDDLLG
jgi:hypothetical protein